MRGVDELAEIVAEVRKGAKYRDLDEGLVRAAVEREAGWQKNRRELIKAVRTRLHQAAGVYLGQGFEERAALEELERLARGDLEGLHQFSLRWMGQHASTRERLPILEPFYAGILEALPAFSSLADYACGLNPLFFPFLPRLAGCRLRGYDVHPGMITVLNRFFALSGLNGQAQVLDLSAELPGAGTDVALLLKAVPCLDQLERGLGWRVLEGIAARWVVVSFPGASLGGHEKGMVANYGARFAEWVQDKPWRVSRLDFPGELVFVVEKGGGAE